MKNKILILSTLTVLAMFLGGELKSICENKNLKFYSLALENPVHIASTLQQEAMETGSNYSKNPSYISKNSNIINSAKDYAVSVSDVSKIINKTYDSSEKMIFLTFDDGPSDTTKKILDILDYEGVNATFFILGRSLEFEGADNIVRDTINRGNAIANHTYSHNYKDLYPKGGVSVSLFMDEVEKTNELLKSMIGENFNTSVIRMPGGYMSREYYNDKNLSSLDVQLGEKEIVQVDWTSENGDGMANDESIDEMIERVAMQTEYQDQVVLLMHDSIGKEKTVEALPRIIKYFKDDNYNFKVIANDKIKTS